MNDKPVKKGGFLLNFIPYLVAIASAVSAILPQNTDDPKIQALKMVLDLLALNVGHSSLVQQEAKLEECFKPPARDIAEPTA